MERKFAFNYQSSTVHGFVLQIAHPMSCGCRYLELETRYSEWCKKEQTYRAKWALDVALHFWRTESQKILNDEVTDKRGQIWNDWKTTQNDIFFVNATAPLLSTVSVDSNIRNDALHQASKATFKLKITIATCASQRITFSAVTKRYAYSPNKPCPLYGLELSAITANEEYQKRMNLRTSKNII